MAWDGPTNEQIADALRRTKGMVYVAADLLAKEHGHCSPNTIKKRLKQYAWLREVKDAAKEMTKDVTELKLFEAIQRGESWAIQFYLKTQAKDRGYGDRVDINVIVRQEAEKFARSMGLDPAEVIAEAESHLREVQR